MLIDEDGLGRMRRILRHRLLNFVSGIKSANTLLSTDLEDRLTLREREYFPMIQRECDQIAVMVNRLDSLFAELPPSAPVALDGVIQVIMIDLRESHPTAEIILNVDSRIYDIRPSVCSVAVKTALVEAVNNACEFSRKPVTIAIRNVGDSCSICVMDEGEPMSEEAQKMAFEPFFTTRPRRVGVGLSLARRIVVDRGGSATIQTTEAGNAVEFVFPYIEIKG